MRTLRQIPTILLLALILSWLSVNAFAQQPNGGASPEWRWGKSNAPVVIEVFSDYQCRRCVAFNTDLKRVQLKYGDKVRMIFREFPLTQIHDKALLAGTIGRGRGPAGKVLSNERPALLEGTRMGTIEESRRAIYYVRPQAKAKR